MRESLCYYNSHTELTVTVYTFPKHTRTDVKKLMRILPGQYSIISSLLLLVVLVFICSLQPTACLAMGPDGICFKNQDPIDRRCNIGSVNVPMNPSPSFRTNCGASVIALPKARIASFKQVEEAPVTKRLCGSAPVTKATGNTYFVERSRNAAPYFAGNQCPKAPIIVSSPSKQVWNHYK